MLFEIDQTVRGMPIIRFLEWAQASEERISSPDVGKAGVPEDGVLALPPIQRTPAWRPRQVVDLWDSVLRGLPIGSSTSSACCRSLSRRVASRTPRLAKE